MRLLSSTIVSLEDPQWGHTILEVPKASLVDEDVNVEGALDFAKVDGITECGSVKVLIFFTF